MTMNDSVMRRREFLRRTALLERMCAPLCEALTGDADAGETLAEIERENLFLIALDCVVGGYVVVSLVTGGQR